ncbi:MAG: hypothetical protein ABW189_06530 [Rickettsiales bacterium]
MSAIWIEEEGIKCRRLWQKVLLQAEMDARSEVNSAQRRAAKTHARAWLTSRDKDFIYICALAGLDPDLTRKGFAALFAEREKRPPTKKRNGGSPKKRPALPPSLPSLDAEPSLKTNLKSGKKKNPSRFLFCREDGQ